MFCCSCRSSPHLGQTIMEGHDTLSNACGLPSSVLVHRKPYRFLYDTA